MHNSRTQPFGFQTHRPRQRHQVPADVLPAFGWRSPSPHRPGEVMWCGSLGDLAMGFFRVGGILAIVMVSNGLCWLVIVWLVSPTPLKNMSESHDDIPNMMGKIIHSCSKAPTRSYGFPRVFQTTKPAKQF